MTDTTRTDPNAVPASQKPSDGELEDFLGTPPPRPWYKRPLFILGIVVIAALIFLLARCFAGPGEGGYATETVRRGNLQVTVTATGNLQPTNEVQVGSEQSGLITQVFVDNNDRVTQGQPLARLDPSRLQDTVTQAQAAVASAQAQVATAQATVAQNRADLARQEEVFRVSNGRVPSRTELDAARATYQRGLASVRAALAGVTEARAQLSSAQTNLSKATIYSPVNGIVLSRQVDPGQTVAASLSAPTLFTIAEDLSQMKLEVRVDEADVGQVSAGQRATFTVDAYPGRTFQATVLRVDVGANASGSTTSGSSASNAASSSTNTVIAYTAVLSVANPEMLLRPGMTATAEIVTAERRNVILVPNAALRWSPERDAASAKGQSGVTSVLVPRGGRRGRGGGGREVSIGRGSRQTVYVLGADGQPQAVQITVGESNGSMTEVVSGDLREGQEVITSRLAPGQVQEKNDRAGNGEGRRRDGDGNGNRAAPANQAAPAPAPANPGGNEAQPASPAAPPVQPQAPPAAPPNRTGGAGPPAPAGGQRMRDMTPEQRRAYIESLTPEQREQMRQRREQRRQQGGGEGGAPDGR